MRARCRCAPIRQTSGWSLAAQDVFNNVARTMIEAMAATQGHTQSLHTNALDEALALPTDFSARIARNTQILLQQESGTTRIIDPWGGSFYVERLTDELAKPRPGRHIQEVEALGGMAKAHRGRHPEAPHRGGLGQDPGAHRRRPAVGDRRQQVPAGERGTPIDVLKVDNSAVRQMQIDKLARLQARARSRRGAEAALGCAHPRAAGGGNGNLLALAGRRRPRQGHGRRDLGGDWRRCSGRHRAEIKSISGVYKREVGGMIGSCRAGAEAGRRRSRATKAAARASWSAKIGQDGHDRGQKVIASAFADLGFDVDIGPLFATPEEAARQAVENDVHILGVSSLAAAHLDAGAGAEGRAREAGPRRHHDRGRRRGAAAGLRRAPQVGRRGDLPARHRDRGGGREAAALAQPAARPQQPAAAE